MTTRKKQIVTTLMLTAITAVSIMAQFNTITALNLPTLLVVIVIVLPIWVFALWLIWSEPVRKA